MPVHSSFNHAIDGNLSEAAELYLKAHQSDPSNAVYPSNLSLTHLRMGNYDIAFHYANVAVQADPKFTKVSSYSFLSGILQKSHGEYEVAQAGGMQG